MVISKGARSKGELLEQARVLLNEEGLGITLADLASKMNMTQGKITYHFPTKDHLFVALAQRYEDIQMSMRSGQVPGAFGLDVFCLRAAEAMDVQYDYRCVIRYIATSVKAQSAVFEHSLSFYTKNKEIISRVMKALIEVKSISPKILDPGKYEIVLFQFTSLFTTWVINLEIYDTDKTYQEMKPVYLKGIFACFNPFTTRKGKAELKKAGLEF
jgi:AcrR family transcriptional regulator